MPQRLRFFPGQLLSAQDFAAEQQYHLEMRRLHNRLLHGAGIVQGLGVSLDTTSSETVVVSPGMALDRLGREIIVQHPARAAIGPCEYDFCYVTLRYAETPTDPVPTASGTSEFSRITEGFAIATALPRVANRRRQTGGRPRPSCTVLCMVPEVNATSHSIAPTRRHTDWC